MTSFSTPTLYSKMQPNSETIKSLQSLRVRSAKILLILNREVSKKSRQISALIWIKTAEANHRSTTHEPQKSRGRVTWFQIFHLQKLGTCHRTVQHMCRQGIVVPVQTINDSLNLFPSRMKGLDQWITIIFNLESLWIIKRQITVLTRPIITTIDRKTQDWTI
jgi:hypothetical protein